MRKNIYQVLKINREDAKDFFLDGHYLKKWPRISYLFGLFLLEELVGAISYGTVSSPAARKSVAGERYSSIVIELNRLFLKNNIKNEASFLISNSIKLLPKPKIIISYADNDQGHYGTIYKASNFIYGGKSEGYHYDWVVKGKEHLHQSTLFREFKNNKDKLAKVKEKYGDMLYKEKRSPKDRFVFVHADKKNKKRNNRKHKMVTLIHGDCIEKTLEIPDESIDLTVTSPPYDKLRTYNGAISQWNEAKWKKLLEGLFRVTKSGGVVVWIVGDATIKGSETGTSFRQALYARDHCGFSSL